MCVWEGLVRRNESSGRRREERGRAGRHGEQIDRDLGSKCIVVYEGRGGGEGRGGEGGVCTLCVLCIVESVSWHACE